MSFINRITVDCQHPGCKHTFVHEGGKATRLEAFDLSKKAGWQWVSAAESYCPDHKKVSEKKTKVAKAAPKGKAAGKTKGKAGKGKAPAIVGASTGKLAKSAKASA